jgi:hypothetical protein
MLVSERIAAIPASMNQEARRHFRYWQFDSLVVSFGQSFNVHAQVPSLDLSQILKDSFPKCIHLLLLPTTRGADA